MICLVGSKIPIQIQIILALMYYLHTVCEVGVVGLVLVSIFDLSEELKKIAIRARRV